MTLKHSAQDVNTPATGQSGALDSATAGADTDGDSASRLRKLGLEFGIADGYLDNWNRHHRTTATEYRALLGALGVNVESGTATGHTGAQALVESLLPAAIVHPAGRALDLKITLPVAIAKAAEDADAPLFAEWYISGESGAQYQGRAAVLVSDGDVPQVAAAALACCGTLALDMPPQLACGYHELRLSIGSAGDGAHAAGTARLILVPETCFASAECSRCTGVAVQLYSVRSARNCGIGDFADLADISVTMASHGVDAIAVNPLHALFWDHPERCSPYSPSSRLFFNPVYLAVDWVAADLNDAELAAAVTHNLQLQPLRQASRLSYQTIVAAKDTLLRQCFETFREHHLQPQTAIAEDFERYCTEFESSLDLHARFEAFAGHFDSDNEFVNWASWPSEIHDPGSDASNALAQRLSDEITYRKFLQWQCHRQLARVNSICEDAGMRIGLYLDLAVGVDVHGAEPWAAPDMYAHGVHIGAPPDALGPLGQDWSLAPYRPDALQRAAFEPFVQMLRSNMRHAGAIRIDHVMGLMRQYWCLPQLAAAGEPPPGSYVHYPFVELLGILALESHRCQCRVIGEDLGTVPDGVRERLEQFGILRYRVQYFEKSQSADGSEEFAAPVNYPALSLATVSTHDLPTIAGFWQGWDIKERARLGLITDEHEVRRQHVERAAECQKLIELLVRHECLEPASRTAAKPDVNDIIQALHTLHLRSPALLVMLQLEDLLAQVEMINLPGTIDEHPNWRRRVAIELEMLECCPGFSRLFDEIASRRQFETQGRSQPASSMRPPEHRSR